MYNCNYNNRLAGAPPFVVDSVDLTKENIIEVRINVFTRILKGILDEPKKLIQQLLQKDQRYNNNNYK